MRYLIVLLLSACAVGGWSRNGDTNWQADYQACDNQTQLATASFNGSAIELGIRQGNLINGCMSARGWRK